MPSTCVTTAALLFLLVAPDLSAEPPNLDRFGDPLPPAARVHLGTVRFRAASYAAPFVLSPDGATLAVVSDRHVHLLDASDGRQLRRLGPFSGEPQSLAFAPDGKALADGGAAPFRTREEAWTGLATSSAA